MYARVSYTCTKQVNAKLWNPGYSLNKVPSEDHVALLVDEPTTTTSNAATSHRTSKSTEPRKSVDSDVFEDSGISDDCSFSGDSMDQGSVSETPESLNEVEIAAAESPKSAEDDIASENDLPLNSSWQIYATRPDVKNWDEKMVQVHRFNSVMEFWALYQHMKLPSHLKQGVDYFFFRSGIEPCWESKDNVRGGRWIVELEKSDRNAHLNSIWLETLLALVGETLGDPSQINGAVVQSRRGKDKVSIWVRDASDSAQIRALGLRFKSIISDRFRIRFQKHEMSTNGSCSRRHSMVI